MSTVAPRTTGSNKDYPTSDGRPMAETDHHRNLMSDLIRTLEAHYADDSMVYVSGNLLLFYEEGNRRRHVSPDVFVVKDVPKHDRLNYLVWEEGKGPDVAIELTSSSTRREDQDKKFKLYRDLLRVREYFLFDPFGDYLSPPLQGYRLRGGTYQPIRPLQGRLPSKQLGLRLEQHGSDLRLYDPAAEQWLLTPQERIAHAEQRAIQGEGELERLRRQIAQYQAENEALRRQVTEIEQLHRQVAQYQSEIEGLRRQVEEWHPAVERWEATVQQVEQLRREVEALRRRQG